MLRALTALTFGLGYYYVIRNIVPYPAFLILASLVDGEKHGHAMVLDIQQFSGVRLGPGTLYGALTRLERRGWIRPMPSEGRRKPYTFTPSGRMYLEEQAIVLDHIARTALVRLEQVAPGDRGRAARLKEQPRS